MTPESRKILKQMLTRDEAYRQFPYVDTTGNLTVAIGRNLKTRGISLDEALVMLDNDISDFNDKLSHFLPWFMALDENRKIALINMCFNMGIQPFLGFKDMISAFERGNYEEAADAMLDSKWSQEVGQRVTRLASIIRTGEIG